MNFQLDIDGKPKVTIISDNMCEDVTLPVETADHSEDDSNRLIWLFVQLNNNVI